MNRPTLWKSHDGFYLYLIDPTHPTMAAVQDLSASSDFGFSFLPELHYDWMACNIRDGCFLIDCSVENGFAFTKVAVSWAMGMAVSIGRYRILPKGLQIGLNTNTMEFTLGKSPFRPDRVSYVETCKLRVPRSGSCRKVLLRLSHVSMTSWVILVGKYSYKQGQMLVLPNKVVVFGSILRI